MNLHPILALIALIPLFVIFYTGYVRVWVWIQVIPFTCAVTALIALLFWQVPVLTVLASLIQGFTISLQHIFFLISLIFFTEVLRATDSLNPLRSFFQDLHPDRRIQAIAIAWFLGGFLEGLIGFSFTGAICSILLIGIGFPPACAILMGIMGPITASPFSCGGTPILFHAATGLQDSSFALQLAASGSTLPEYLQLVTSYIGMINGVIGTFMPLGMILMITRFYGKNRSWKEAWDIAPFALFCGLAFTFPYALTAVFLGPSFPSIFGAIVGFALMLAALRLKFLIPRKKWDFESVSKWEPAWYEGHYEKPEPPSQKSPYLAWIPFVLLFVFLLLIQWPDSSINSFLKSYVFKKENFLGTTIALVIRPFYLPHTLLILLISILTLAVHRFKNTERIFNQRLSIFVTKAFLSLPFIMSIAALYLNSGINNNGFPAMHEVIAQQMTLLPISEIFHFMISPWLAAAITDVSSSGMYCTALMSSFQHHLGRNLIGNGAFFVAIHICAATAGHMFSGHYLNGVSLHSGKAGLTGPVGRLAMRPLLIYLLLAGIISYCVNLLI